MTCTFLRADVHFSIMKFIYHYLYKCDITWQQRNVSCGWGNKGPIIHKVACKTFVCVNFFAYVFAISA